MVGFTGVWIGVVRFLLATDLIWWCYELLVNDFMIILVVWILFVGLGGFLGWVLVIA